MIIVDSTKLVSVIEALLHVHTRTTLLVIPIRFIVQNTEKRRRKSDNSDVICFFFSSRENHNTINALVYKYKFIQ